LRRHKPSWSHRAKAGHPRRFGGVVYRMAESYVRKPDAVRHARDVRRFGFRARVTRETDGRWVVWVSLMGGR